MRTICEYVCFHIWFAYLIFIASWFGFLWHSMRHCILLCFECMCVCVCGRRQKCMLQTVFRIRYWIRQSNWMAQAMKRTQTGPLCQWMSHKQKLHVSLLLFFFSCDAITTRAHINPLENAVLILLFTMHVRMILTFGLVYWISNGNGISLRRRFEEKKNHANTSRFTIIHIGCIVPQAKFA